MPGLSANWGGGGGMFDFRKYLDPAQRGNPLDSRVNPSDYYSVTSIYDPISWGQMNAKIDRRNMALQSQQAGMQGGGMNDKLLSHLMGLQRDAFGATANMTTNRQVERGLNYLDPAVENARQGTVDGGISDDEYDRGISDVRQRAAAQGRAMQGAITSALAQRGVTNPLAGAIAGMKAQFEGGRAAGAARADYDRARQQGRISYSGMYGNMAGNQADLATRPTQENALNALSTIAGMRPRKKFRPEYL